MHIPDAEAYRLKLEEVICQHSTRPIQLFIVDDIQRWDEENGILANGNPSGQAVPLGGGWGILIRRSIDKQRVEGVQGALLMTNGEDRLTTPELFLRHLVLHELAHIENDWGQSFEAQCDEWASDRL